MTNRSGPLGLLKGRFQGPWRSKWDPISSLADGSRRGMRTSGPIESGSVVWSGIERPFVVRPASVSGGCYDGAIVECQSLQRLAVLVEKRISLR